VKPAPTINPAPRTRPVEEGLPAELRDQQLLCTLTLRDAIGAQSPHERAIACRAHEAACAAWGHVSRELVARAQDAGELMHADTVQRVLAAEAGKLRSLLESLPTAQAAACNPGDPDLAQAVLDDAVQQILDAISDPQTILPAVPAAPRKGRKPSRPPAKGEA
jgi:hypothetical protein